MGLVMRPGVQSIDILTGSGDEATSDKRVVVNVGFSLADGTALTDFCGNGRRLIIDLRRRDCIAGLRYGIEGMRVGGKRKLTIAPHLAYGKQGILGRIPPDSTLWCEVELLEVREHGVVKPEDCPPGLKLQVGNTGDIKSNTAEWQFGLDEDGRWTVHASSCRRTRQGCAGERTLTRQAPAILRLARAELVLRCTRQQVCMRSLVAGRAAAAACAR